MGAGFFFFFYAVGCFPHAFQLVFHIVHIRHADGIDDKFVPAHAHDYVRIPELVLQRVGHGFQGLISRGMTVGVIDMLEIIHVDDHISAGDRILQEAADQGFTPAAVIYAGQHIVLRFQFCIGAGCHILHPLRQDPQCEVYDDHEYHEQMDQVHAERIALPPCDIHEDKCQRPGSGQNQDSAQRIPDEKRQNQQEKQVDIIRA